MAWTSSDPLKRFLKFVRKDESGCWLWTGSINKRWGYGSFFKGRPPNSRRSGATRAHRWAYEAFRGPIPPGLLVCHKCDVRHCVNPDHLFIGTHKDNAQDMVRKGRLHPLVASGHFLRVARMHQAGHKIRRPAKLTNEQVRDILASSERGIVLAARYNVSSSLITRIRQRSRRAHID